MVCTVVSLLVLRMFSQDTTGVIPLNIYFEAWFREELIQGKFFEGDEEEPEEER